jgi:hypothetical protein
MEAYCKRNDAPKRFEGKLFIYLKNAHNDKWDIGQDDYYRKVKMKHFM